MRPPELVRGSKAERLSGVAYAELTTPAVTLLWGLRCCADGCRRWVLAERQFAALCGSVEGPAVLRAFDAACRLYLEGGYRPVQARAYDATMLSLDEARLLTACFLLQEGHATLAASLLRWTHRPRTAADLARSLTAVAAGFARAGHRLASLPQPDRPKPAAHRPEDPTGCVDPTRWPSASP
jgi:hypothetical protein